MIFQLKLNESYTIVEKELNLCGIGMGSYYYILWIQRITRIVLCDPNLNNPFN